MKKLRIFDGSDIKNIIDDNVLKNIENVKMVKPLEMAKPLENLKDSVANKLGNEIENELLIDKKTVDRIKKERSDKIEESITTKRKKENYFGYNIFSNTDISQFTDPYESIDPNYIIGPGDEIIIMLWGETELFNFIIYLKRDFSLYQT